MENFARILDYLPNGRQTERGFHREPLALALGEDELKLLELVPRPGAVLAAGQRIPLLPVGPTPPPIDHVRRRPRESGPLPEGLQRGPGGLPTVPPARAAARHR